MSITVFDIETGPLPEAQLRELCPPFNPDDVKTGNTKDAAKIEAKIEEARAGHFDDFCGRAALDARYGRILAFGSRHQGSNTIFDGDETDIVSSALSLLKDRLAYGLVSGFNIRSFDIPFLVRRAWHHGIKLPRGIVNYWKGRSGFHDNFIDLRTVWQLGDYQAHGSLDSVCQHMRLGKKNGSGADFAGLFMVNREAALDYLRHDLELTSALAERML